MRLVTVRRSFTEGDVYRLYPWGDFHVVNSSCDMGALIDTRNAIKDDPMAMHLFMGDAAEFITEKDPRWSAGGVDPDIIPAGQQGRIGDLTVEWLSEFFSPIADKCIGYHDGNHEKAMNKHNSTNVSSRTIKLAGIDANLHTPGMAMTRIVFTDSSKHACSLIVNSSHGNQTGRMDGAKINQMKQALAYFRCDIMLRGHSHSFFASPADWLEPNANHTKLVAKRGYVSHTGSFLRTYEQDQDSYAEDGDYPPTSIGCPIFEIRPSRDGVKIRAIT